VLCAAQDKHHLYFLFDLMPGGDLMDVLVAEAKIIKHPVPQKGSLRQGCLSPKVGAATACVPASCQQIWRLPSPLAVGAAQCMLLPCSAADDVGGLRQQLSHTQLASVSPCTPYATECCCQHTILAVICECCWQQHASMAVFL
jgi:hypothetical protein